MTIGHEKIYYSFSEAEGVYTPVSMIEGRSLFLQNDTVGGTSFQWKIGTRVAGTSEDLTLTDVELTTFNDQIVFNPADPTGAYFPVTLTVDGKYIGTRNIVLEHNLP